MHDLAIHVGEVEVPTGVASGQRFALDLLGTYTVTKRQLGQNTILHDSNPGQVRTEDELESSKRFLIEFQKQ